MFSRVLVVVLLLAAVGAVIVPFTGRQRPYFPSPPAYGPGANQAIKYRPGESYRGSISGPRSVRGLRRLNSLRADLHVEGGPALSLPVKTLAKGDEWEDVILVDKRYEVAPVSISFEAGPFPDDARLPGASATLAVVADLTYPHKVSDEAFEPRSESFREIVTLSFYAPGEYEKEIEARRQSDEQRARVTAAFYRNLTIKRIVWWSLAGVCLILAGALAVFVFRTEARRRNGE